MLRRCITYCFVFLSLCTASVLADPPQAKYLFPAGGQRGTVVPVRIGGCNFHGRANFHLSGSGLTAAPEIARIETVWFEGPIIPLPASQQKEDYPRDYANSMHVASDAQLGLCLCRVSTSQGVTASMPFVVGELPEVVEVEVPGEPTPTNIKLPVTVNGRIFPREDVDLWTFHAEAGQALTCAVDAQRLGSPLLARLELLDGQAKTIAESLTLPNDDAVIRFTAPATGNYTIKVHDISFGGLQDYVYRMTLTAGPYLDQAFPLGGRRGSHVALELTGANLTETRDTVQLPNTLESSFDYRATSSSQTTNSLSLELDDLPEFVESDVQQAITFPSVLNGRILQPGEIDEWSFQAKQGEELDFDLRAARLGSLLDSTLQVINADHKVLAENDDLGSGQSDSRLRFQVAADGEYRVRIADRLPKRGGPRFGYRLRITHATQPDFQLIAGSDAVTVERDKPTTWKLAVDRGPGVTDEIALQIDGLPEGVTVTPLVIPKQQPEVNLTFKAADKAKITCTQLRIRGEAVVSGRKITRTLTLNRHPGGGEASSVWLAVAIPTPFRFEGIYETKYMPRGSSYARHYLIQRNGFGGALEASLADKQGRHLQGVTGQPVAVSPGQSEFDFTVKLPPWMEIGRTSRTNLSLVGTVVDFDGSQHVVSYSSNSQNDQLIALVDPGRLAVSTDRRTFPAAPGSQAIIAIRLQRSNGLKQPVQIDAAVPNGMRGVSANRIIVAPDSERAQFEVTFDKQEIGPFQTPLIIRATTVDERNLPVVAETPVEFVVQK